MKFIGALALAASATASVIPSRCSNFIGSGSFGAPVNGQPAQAQITNVANLMANLEMVHRGENMEQFDEGPKKNRIIILLDNSSSMDEISAETINAYNTVLRQLKGMESAIGLETKFSLMTFNGNSGASLHTSDSINQADLLTTQTYQTQGYTALYDAVGCTLEALNTEENNQLIVITDGYENDSAVFENVDDVKDLVLEALDERLWDITMIGSEDKSENDAADMGISDFVKFEATERGVSEALGEAGNLISEGMVRRARRY
jgi:Mg-chelatase subunit ChlD